MYSRKLRTEEKRNIRNAYVLIASSVLLLFVFFIFGLPAMAKFAAFLTELRKSSAPVETTDSTPPTPPRFDPLPEYTNSLKLEVGGKTEAGVIVKLFINNKEEEVITNSEGEFHYTFSLQDGENNISAVSRDSAGNESNETQSVKIIYDNKAPELTISKPQDGSSFFGSRERQISVEGQTEQGVSVNINQRQVVVENDGTFSYVTTLSDGENAFLIKVQDKAGNITEKTLKVTFHP